MSPTRTLLAVSLFLLLASLASAQVLEIGPQFGVNRLSNNVLSQSDGAKLASGFRFGFRVGLNSHARLGHEAGYAYNRTNLEYAGTKYGMATHQGFYDLLLYPIEEGSKVRPFIAGGVQFSNFVPPGSSATSGGGDTKFGVNYGAGVKVRATEKFLIRLGVQQFLSPKPDWFFEAPKGWLRINEISLGVSYTL
ncbi:MAG TPA: outer membrane beta-barrel protein [Bryobacteraceae bacterium]|nr:outer membrane beta-barrel protein [Bryobacteraceae bacterium]